LDQNFTQFGVGTFGTTSYLVGYDSTLNLEQRYPYSTVLSYINSNLPVATSSTAGIASAGAGLTMTGSVMSANVTSVVGRTGAITLSYTDVTNAANSGANSNITSLTALTARPTWNLSSVVTTPWDNGNLLVIGGRLLSYQIVTSSSTVTVPANCAYIIGEGVGAGGGSGGSAGAGSSQVSIGQSGAGGTYCKFQILTPPSTLTVTLGAAGTAGAAAAGGNGGTGGTTTVANGATTYVSIPGGTGGVSGTVTTYSTAYVIPTPALSSLATGTAALIENQSGSLPPLAYAVGSVAAQVASAPGGSSRWGAGAPSSSAGTAGTAATQYGAGASGCALSASTAAATGGAGGASKVILYFYASQ
jgi:hypothetical protein